MRGRANGNAKLLLTIASVALAVPPAVAVASSPSTGPQLQLPGLSIAIEQQLEAAGATERLARTRLEVRVTNTSSASFAVSRSDFALSADGDMFGAQEWNDGSAQISIPPRHSRAIRLSFAAPEAAAREANLVYRSAGTGLSRVASLNGGSGFSAPWGINTFSVARGAGDPWGVTLDKRGDVWFAEPGCDFAPICPSGTPPGQIGELKASSHRVMFYRLPNISGNQPIFVTFDRSGNLWFTTPNNSKIGEFRPSIRKFVGQWSVTPGTGPWDLAFSGGAIWYTEHLASAVGRFSPVTHRHHDFRTPSAHSNPYGIAASGGLIWFTENNSTVDRVAVLNTHKRRNAISEYTIAQPQNGTPHMISIGEWGHPWWTEGFANTIATLNPDAARPGTCSLTASGSCRGVRRFELPPSGCSSYGSHVSGITVQRRGGLVWLDDSLRAEVGWFDPRSRRFDLATLSGCNDHPDDGLALDRHNDAWFNEEFGSAIGELRQ